MSTDNHVNESILNSDIKEWQKKNRIDHMAYLPGMEVLESEVQAQVIESMNAYDYTGYTEKDVRRALEHDNRTPEDFAALLSPAALPLLEEMAPVSYTHLDVYKRQGGRPGIRRFRAGGNRHSGGNHPGMAGCGTEYRICTGKRNLGTGNQLPLRAGPGDACSDHGRKWNGSEERDHVQDRRFPGRSRQDADRGT